MPDASHPGILPCQSIEALIAERAIAAALPFASDQVQPASLDLRLGERAWRVRASFLPGLGRRVADRIADVAMHELDLTKGAVLERGCVYIAEIAERLALPADVSARANPKSSTGRVDVFVRALTDHGPAFDDIAEGYAGPLYLEIAPQTFSVLARAGTRLNQLRLRRGEPPALSVRSVGVDLSERAGRLPGAPPRRRHRSRPRERPRPARLLGAAGAAPRRAAARPRRVLHPGLQGGGGDPGAGGGRDDPDRPGGGRVPGPLRGLLRSRLRRRRDRQRRRPRRPGGAQPRDAVPAWRTARSSPASSTSRSPSGRRGSTARTAATTSARD